MGNSALISIPLTTPQHAQAEQRFLEDKEMIKYKTYDFNFGEIEFDLETKTMEYHIYSTQNADQLMFKMTIPIGNGGKPVGNTFLDIHETKIKYGGIFALGFLFTTFIVKLTKKYKNQNNVYHSLMDEE